jgi:hypothetical protein
MTARDPSRGPKKTVTLSLVLGALLIPMAAFGASYLVSASNQAPLPDTALVVSTTAAAVPAPEPGAADIALACGEEGMQLVAAEANGTIGDVQQAALDALRDICAAEGIPLPAPAVSAGPSTPAVVNAALTTATTSAHTDDDHNDDHEDDDDHDDDGDDD